MWSWTGRIEIVPAPDESVYPYNVRVIDLVSGEIDDGAVWGHFSYERARQQAKELQSTLQYSKSIDGARPIDVYGPNVNPKKEHKRNLRDLLRLRKELD